MKMQTQNQEQARFQNQEQALFQNKSKALKILVAVSVLAASLLFSYRASWTGCPQKVNEKPQEASSIITR